MANQFVIKEVVLGTYPGFTKKLQVMEDGIYRIYYDTGDQKKNPRSVVFTKQEWRKAMEESQGAL